MQGNGDWYRLLKINSLIKMFKKNSKKKWINKNKLSKVQMNKFSKNNNKN